jgi:Secretion system C-terminal sorting domain
MKKMILSLCCCIAGFGATTLYAQQGNLASGGDASGTGGTVSFSIGQVFYSSASGTSQNLNQGIQQPFEISVLNSVEEKAADINLTASVFPNPTISNFTLKVETTKWKNLSYELYNAQGSLLLSKKVEVDETIIEISGLASAFYILKVHDGNQSIKTFKITKYY